LRDLIGKPGRSVPIVSPFSLALSREVILTSARDLPSFPLMRTSPLAILLFAVAAFLGALGQFFYKMG